MYLPCFELDSMEVLFIWRGEIIQSKDPILKFQAWNSLDWLHWYKIGLQNQL